MIRRIACLIVVCGFALGVLACGSSGQPDAGASAGAPRPSGGAGDKAQPASQQSNNQPQSGAQVADAGKDAGKDAASAGKSFGKAATELGKSVVSGSTKVGLAAADTATDAAITAAVNSRLKAEMPADAIKVSALTNAGVVTLKGSVPTSTARTKAEQIAKSTSGVKGVVNQLDVK